MSTIGIPKLLFLVGLVLLIGSANGQTVVDRTMAVVADGTRTELITLSDLKWQLALQPRKVIDPLLQSDLDEALRLVIEQRIFALEAERLPRNAPTPVEIQEEIAKILAFFPSTAEFERRLRHVGFTSVRDENFERLISKRLAIEKYIQFRFRSFIVVTSAEEKLIITVSTCPNSGEVIPDALCRFSTRAEYLSTSELSREGLDQYPIVLDQAKLRIDVTILNGN